MQTHDSSAPRLLDQVRDRIRRKHFSIRTEQAYTHWVKAFVRFHGMKHPSLMGAREVESYLTHLSVERNVSSSTQNQALSALLFLYREVLEIELPWLDGIERSKRPKRMPVVLTQDEVAAVLGQLDGTTALILKLAYGTGMRIMEVVRLRVKDVEFARGEILIREGKGSRDRVTMLPASLMLPLRDHLARVRTLHERDCKEGLGEVFLPFRIGAEISEGRTRLGLAVRVSIEQAQHRPALGKARASSCRSAESATADAHGSAGGRRKQAGDTAHPASFFRYASAPIRLRHSHRSGIARAQGCADHDDLHPRVESRRARRGEPIGQTPGNL